MYQDEKNMYQDEKNMYQDEKNMYQDEQYMYQDEKSKIPLKIHFVFIKVTELRSSEIGSNSMVSSMVPTLLKYFYHPLKGPPLIRNMCPPYSTFSGTEVPIP